MDDKPRTVLFIDPEKRTVTERVIEGHNAIHKLLGGYLEMAHMWPTGDVLYTDEDGFVKELRYGFRIMERPDQPLAGPGVIVGKERGESTWTYAPKISATDAMLRVMWLEFRGE